MDSNTGEPVVFATVRVMGKAKGVITNMDGSFRLPKEYMDATDSIEISSMGYESKEVSRALFADNIILELKLTPALLVLDEVIVKERKRRVLRGLTAREIVHKAIENLPLNVPRSSYSYVGYYRDYQLYNLDYLNLNEALIQIFDRGFEHSDYETTELGLFSYKRNSDFLIDTIGLKPYDYKSGHKTISDAFLDSYGGNELVILRIHDPIRNHDKNTFDFVNVFQSDFTRNHTFNREEDQILDGSYLYHISFSSSIKEWDVKGNLYITKDSFAIHGFEYAVFYNTKRINNGIDLLFETKLEYKRKEGKMYLSYHSMNNSFRLVKPPKLKLEQTILDFNRNQLVLEFTNDLEEESALRLANYDIRFNGQKLKFKAIVHIGNEVSLIPDVQNKRTRNLFRELIYSVNSDKIKSGDLIVDIKNVKDENGNVVNEPEYENRKQFREFFVQELQLGPTTIPRDDFFMDKGKPIFVDQPIKRPENFSDYWMNTPLKSIED